MHSYLITLSTWGSKGCQVGVVPLVWGARAFFRSLVSQLLVFDTQLSPVPPSSCNMCSGHTLGSGFDEPAKPSE